MYYIQYCFTNPEYTLNAFKLFNTSLLMNFGGILKEIYQKPDKISKNRISSRITNEAKAKANWTMPKTF